MIRRGSQLRWRTQTCVRSWSSALQSLTRSYHAHSHHFDTFPKTPLFKKRGIKALSLILEFFLSSVRFLKKIVYKIDLNYEKSVSKIKGSK